MKIKQKKGISLIVLIITIIVMIILAAAIILSLSSSGIIGKANEAKIANDIANLKEQAESVKIDEELKALENNQKLTQAQLVEAINTEFKGSTIAANIITTEDGKYDIVVENNLMITVVEHGKYTGPTKDIEISYTTTELAEGKQLNLRVDLLNVPNVNSYDETTFINKFQEEFLNWMNWKELLVLGGNLLQPGAGLTAENVYDAKLLSILGVDYATFEADEDRDELVKIKTGYETTEILIKYMIVNELDQDTIVYIGLKLLYAKDLLPILSEKTTEEIQMVVESWYNNEKTIDQITKEAAATQDITVETFEEFYASLSIPFGITDEAAYIFNRKQAMLIVASAAYVDTHPLVIKYPDETVKEYNWFEETYVEDESYTLTKNRKLYNKSN